LTGNFDKHEVTNFGINYMHGCALHKCFKYSPKIRKSTLSEKPVMTNFEIHTLFAVPAFFEYFYKIKADN
jgi:hypothetical protein